MPVNPNTPNSNSDLDSFSQRVTSSVSKAFGNVGNISVKDILGGNVLDATVERKLGQRPAVILEELINNLDNPILKSLVMDSITVASNWFEDPEVLCCLIQGIWAMYAASYSNTVLAKIQREGIGISETDFAKWLDVLTAFVDVLIVFIGSDLKKLAIVIPDFIKEISNGVVGGVLLVLQEVLFSLRDCSINAILYSIDRARNDSLNMSTIWAKCIPFHNLLDVMKKYVSDYGLFADLFEKIKGYVSGKVGDFGYIKELDYPKSVHDIEFLYWFRDLLVKLKQATINFDLCVFYGAAAPGGPIDSDNDSETVAKGTPPGMTSTLTTRPNPNEVQGIKVAADGTILQDKDKMETIPILSNSSVRTFLNKYYGYPLDVVDNILTGSSSADAIEGTNINSDRVSLLNADCPNTPNPEEVVRWALRIRNRNL